MTLDVSNEQMNQYKEQILIDRLMGKVPPLRGGNQYVQSRITNEHIKYIRELVGVTKYVHLDWGIKFELIDYLKN
jgi:phenylalanyl-tRNA synthetase beta subunit